jgi:DNA-binding NtrC family response regulator
MLPCLEHMAAEEGLPPPFPPSLSRLPCSGNFRELRNRIARWRLFGQPSEPDETGGATELLEAEDIASNLHLLERILLHRALRRSYGNRTQTAKRLGVSRRQLYLLIARHGDPVRGEPAVSDGPNRLTKLGHN